MSEFSYEELYALLEGRNKERPEGSYTTYLFEKGLDKILKKVGEECTEVIIGGHPDRRVGTGEGGGTGDRGRAQRQQRSEQLYSSSLPCHK